MPGATTASTPCCATLTVDELNRELPGFGLETVREQLIHLIGCEDYWVSMISGTPHVGYEPGPGIDALVELKARVFARTQAYIAGLGDTALMAGVAMTHRDGTVNTAPPAFVIAHVITHAYHHKGQVVAMCRLLGKPAPDTDMLREDAAYLRQ
jgi:uncharacterized damage-inducible protein DinB